ncbi:MULTISPECIES: hypothetical protein [unclassified Bradyrhizobium]|uniref:hypothetical protein n=1 Tax=unclassified Bradyrhizobium TaxID=2631580 RepID=UPI001FF7F323|nr:MULTISPECIES: hypothetical protein [unclassified Bradyrhizobium]MCK1711666.1 hypothetical protein [Bradyrhizobium sp. 143]MCK1725940.1 hypothetical protein [Bradyrhizobium sp. 142]
MTAERAGSTINPSAPCDVTLRALLDAGYRDEAKAFREWGLRAAGGEPEKVRIMYRVDDSRGFEEWTRAAASQRQLDLYGELLEFNSCRSES